VFVAVQEARRVALDEFLGGRARTETILNGVPLIDVASFRHVREEKRRELGLTDRDFLVLGLGRLVEQKRPFLFLTAARELRQNLPSAKFIWVGDGNLAERWKQWIVRERLDGVISHAGWQANPLPFLLAADLLLHVAEFEGLPLSIIEAMAAGLPVAVTRGFASEIPLFDERSVLFLEEPQALAEKLRDPGALRAVRDRSRHLVEQQLSIRAMTSSYERLYAEAVQG
jgi:glycosyltransferase involved in cell wall biosynthesis